MRLVRFVGVLFFLPLVALSVSAATKTQARLILSGRFGIRWKATLDLTVDDISIGGKNDILGKAVIIHAKADDLKSQPAGAAGARIAGGVIQAK